MSSRRRPRPLGPRRPRPIRLTCAIPPVRLRRELIDATDEVWEERIRGVRRSYIDSCSRLTGALGQLEQTLCGLIGDEYRPEQPLLHARAHMQRKLEMLNGR